MKKTNKHLDELKIWLTPGVGLYTFYKIKNFFGDNISEVFRTDTKTLQEWNLTAPVIDCLLHKHDFLQKALNEELANIEKHNIYLLTIDDPKYPNSLKNIYQPPPFLFVKGDVEKLSTDCVAIVGTRYPSAYGSEIAEKIARELASQDVTIVSGLARGIDANAHRGALETGNTIAVIGNGFQYIYPSENKKIYEKILEQNTIVTETPFFTRPEKFNFPLRNRIISGLSKGVLVIEATEKSGSLITASHAAEQGKEVFAIPGEITNPRAIGTNKLIKDGAKIVLSAEDIFEEIFDYKKILEIKNKHKKSTIDGLDDIDKKIYETITNNGRIHVDTISENLGLHINILIGKLLNLELKNLIKELPGKFYCNDI